MNDIKWHYEKDDDFYDLLDRMRNWMMLVETNTGAYRVSNTKYWDSYTNKLTDVDERIVRFAFIEE